jgi:hypothetical protein
MWDVSSVIFVGISGICLVLVLRVVALGIRRSVPKADILYRAGRPLAFGLMALRFGIPRTQRIVVIGLVLLGLAAVVLALRQWRIERGKRQSDPLQVE